MRPRRSPARPRRSWLRTFASLGTRNYRLFVTGQVVSNTGTWMQRVAQDWLVLQLTHGSGTALGIATGLQFLPQLLFSLWGGMIADRYPKRRILIATQAAMGALALLLGVLALTGAVAVWQVYRSRSRWAWWRWWTTPPARRLSRRWSAGTGWRTPSR